MDQLVLYLVTMVVTWLLGILAKKYKYINSNLIPLQNLIIGVLVMSAEWLITKDINAALAMSGIMAGGTYDLVHNLDKIINIPGVDLDELEPVEIIDEEEQTEFNTDDLENMEEE